jgi:two-component system LytT family response regulator
MKPQFVFLDIMMEPFTGFDLLNRFDEIDFEVIFTTTYQDFAYKAIKISAVDFLLKPFGEEEIKLAVKKLKERITSKQTLEIPEFAQAKYSEKTGSYAGGYSCSYRVQIC